MTSLLPSNLQTMTLQGLYGCLLTHELEIRQRKGQTKNSKTKSLALISSNRVRSIESKPKLESDITEEDSDEEEGNLAELHELSEPITMLAMKYK